MQGPTGSRSTSDTGQADQQAAQAEADMIEAGDVGEWLGMDSSRKFVTTAVDGHCEADSDPLSRKASSSQLDEVRLCP